MDVGKKIDQYELLQCNYYCQFLNASRISAGLLYYANALVMQAQYVVIYCISYVINDHKFHVMPMLSEIL
jgi:hypothetical protein